MIAGIGLDFIAVSRIAHWLEDEFLCLRFFHPAEIAEVRSRGAEAPRSLAARFAAKEAFAKAVGTGFSGLVLKDIRVENDGNGKPVLILEGSAAAAMKRTGATRAHLSLTHDGDLAAAQVILED
jgi:holo-[acyl-carrier protein] synthase